MRVLYQSGPALAMPIVGPARRNLLLEWLADRLGAAWMTPAAFDDLRYRGMSPPAVLRTITELAECGQISLRRGFGTTFEIRLARQQGVR